MLVKHILEPVPRRIEAKKLREQFSYQVPVISAPMKKLAPEQQEWKKELDIVPPSLPPATPKKGKSRAETNSLAQNAGTGVRRSTRERIPSQRYNNNLDETVF